MFPVTTPSCLGLVKIANLQYIEYKHSKKEIVIWLLRFVLRLKPSKGWTT